VSLLLLLAVKKAPIHNWHVFFTSKCTYFLRLENDRNEPNSQTIGYQIAACRLPLSSCPSNKSKSMH
jgi:hypothetical protein